MFALDRHVSTQCVYYESYSFTCSHVSIHFLTYEVMFVTISHRCTRNKVHHNFLNLQTFLTMQLLTYKDVSMRKLSQIVCVQLTTYKFPMFYLDLHVSLFDHYDGLYAVFTVKTTQLYTTFWVAGSCPYANIHIQGLNAFCMQVFFILFYLYGGLKK